MQGLGQAMQGLGQTVQGLGYSVQGLDQVVQRLGIVQTLQIFFSDRKLDDNDNHNKNTSKKENTSVLPKEQAHAPPIAMSIKTSYIYLIH